MQKSIFDNKLGYVVYGHVGDGNLHTRPLIDMESQSEVELMERLAHNIFDRVIRSVVQSQENMVMDWLE